MEKNYFQAYHYNGALKLKELDRVMPLQALSRSATSLIYKDDNESFVYFYRFGSFVFFNVSPERQTVIIDKLKSFIGEDFKIVTSEEYAYEVNPAAKVMGVDFDCVTSDKFERERIDIIAFVLAQSTALEHFENIIDDLLEKAGSIMKLMARKGRLSARSKEINKFIGFCMTTKRHLLSSLYLLDKPEETWDDAMLEKLYRDTSDMFELKERYKTLDNKLDMIRDNLGLMSNLIAARRANYLELAIIVLIVIEIILFVMGMV